jgi:hypothetical protein
VIERDADLSELRQGRRRDDLEDAVGDDHAADRDRRRPPLGQVEGAAAGDHQVRAVDRDPSRGAVEDHGAQRRQLDVDPGDRQPQGAEVLTLDGEIAQRGLAADQG